MFHKINKDAPVANLDKFTDSAQNKDLHSLYSFTDSKKKDYEGLKFRKGQKEVLPNPSNVQYVMTNLSRITFCFQINEVNVHTTSS